ncbi:MAG: hypothetical protein ACI4SS_04345 [Clostridia bacterium]
MNTSSELGKKKLVVFQRYSDTEPSELGTYETVIIAANTAQHDEYSDIKKGCLNYHGYYGAVFRGKEFGYDITKCERCLFTPLTNDEGGETDDLYFVEDLSYLYHTTSTVLDNENLDKISLNGFLVEKCNPFLGWHSPEYPRTNKEFQKIIKVESLTKFVPGSVPAKALTVANSRLYCLFGNAVYVSGFNNYADFTMNFSQDEGAGDPWSSLSAGNAATIGDFVAIIPYGNKVVCFKSNCTMEVRGTSAPFTLVTSSEVGAVSSDAVCDYGGYLIFVGRDNVYIYTGSEPEPVADALCLKNITAASIAARDGYLFCVFTVMQSDNADYTDTYVMSLDNGCWSRLSMPYDDAQFTNAKDGLYCLADTKDDGYHLFKMGEKWPEKWFFETAYISGSTYDNLMLSGLNMIYDMDKGSFLKISIRYYPDEDYTVIWQQRASKKIQKQKLKYSFKDKLCGGYQVKVEGEFYGCVYALEISQRVKS